MDIHTHCFTVHQPFSLCTGSVVNSAVIGRPACRRYWYIWYRIGAAAYSHVSCNLCARQLCSFRLGQNNNEEEDEVERVLQPSAAANLSQHQVLQNHFFTLDCRNFTSCKSVHGIECSVQSNNQSSIPVWKASIFWRISENWHAGNKT